MTAGVGAHPCGCPGQGQAQPLHIENTPHVVGLIAMHMV